MSLSQVEKNLIVFLDPICERGSKDWFFIGPGNATAVHAYESSRTRKEVCTILCFNRRNLLRYFLFSWKNKLLERNVLTRRILFVNDGFLSCIFDVENTAYYRYFAARNLPKPNDFRKIIRSFVPVFWRAEKRYIVIEQNDNSCEEFQKHRLNSGEEPNFMFYSNEMRKLLLIHGDKLYTGCGQMIITTANPDYGKVLVREYNTISRIARLLDKPGMLPRVGENFMAGERFIFLEDYIQGRNLRELLYELGREHSFEKACSVLGRITLWFENYRSLFSGEKKTLLSFYSPMLELFSECYGGYEHALMLYRFGKELLLRISRDIGGIVPIIAHNDLWPGNFIISGDDLTVIDWERASEERPPIFDFFWMIISASNEFHAGQIGGYDYSRVFRIFTENKDAVSSKAHDILCNFLNVLGFGEKYYKQFLFFFLMEWSIKDYSVLGKKSFMDELVFKEFVVFAGKYENDIKIC